MRHSLIGTIIISLSSALLASCSDSLSVSPPATGTVQEYFWSSIALSHGINYYVVRNGVGTTHRLSSYDGIHIHDAALSNEVTMEVHESVDSVIVDSMGTNSLFSLPSGYFFGSVLPPDTTIDSLFIRDTVTIIKTKVDSTGKDTTYDTLPPQVRTRDTAIAHITPGDTVMDGLLVLYQPDLDSGASWQAGTIDGPGLGNGVPVIATVLHHDDSLLLKPDTAGADSTFEESFQIRYVPQIPGDSQMSLIPMYWLAYYCKHIGPVLIEQYTLGAGGTYSITRRAQFVSEEP